MRGKIGKGVDGRVTFLKEWLVVGRVVVCRWLVEEANPLSGGGNAGEVSMAILMESLARGERCLRVPDPAIDR